VDTHTRVYVSLVRIESLVIYTEYVDAQLSCDNLLILALPVRLGSGVLKQRVKNAYPQNVTNGIKRRFVSEVVI
jgi:hypothetical protein